ncbi:hypothetical protein [Peribacillus frigoritolerans]|uniref:hypothetical protein n=1 Tax=Peribacillus frigoritolerans TaxID=450367 RepID=UPI0032E4C0D5
MKFKPDDYPFKLKQISCFDDLKEDIVSMREMRLGELKGIVREEAKTFRTRPELVKTVFKSLNSGKVEFKVN